MLATSPFFSFFCTLAGSDLLSGLLDEAEVDSKRIGERERAMNGTPPAVRETSRETRGEPYGDGQLPQRMEVAGDLSCGVPDGEDGRVLEAETMVLYLRVGEGGGVEGMLEV